MLNLAKQRVNLNQEWSEKIADIRTATWQNSPLIHCLTHPIIINSAANLVLALGAKPIMAEHPQEVGDITKASKALSLSLGNITPSRALALRKSAQTAAKIGLPSVLDLVGVGVSQYRYNLANYLISTGGISLIKGNMSEILSMLNLPNNPKGVEVGQNDKITLENYRQKAELAVRLAEQTKTAVLATGVIDIIATAKEVWLTQNGTPTLANVTGTGCLVTVMIATYLASGTVVEAAVLASLSMGVAGEVWAKKVETLQQPCGQAGYAVGLLDSISLLKTVDIIKQGQLYKL